MIVAFVSRLELASHDLRGWEATYEGLGSDTLARAFHFGSCQSILLRGGS